MGEPLALTAAGRGIADADVAASTPLVRALVVERLEMMWRSCQPHITGEMGKPDPRFIEAGIRVTDRLMRLYRLDAPLPGDNEPDPGSRVDARDLARRAVEALEAKLASGD